LTYALAYCEDASGDLVSGNDWESSRNFALNEVKIGAADATGVHFHQHLTRARFGQAKHDFRQPGRLCRSGRPQ
jgi:hypothetical protein